MSKNREMMMVFVRTGFVLVLAASTVPHKAEAAEPQFKKADFLTRHPAATIRRASIVCRSSDDYSHFMDLVREDAAASVEFIVGKTQTGACIGLAAGTPVTVEDPDALKPSRFHVLGKLAPLWIYIEGLSVEGVPE